MLKRLPASAAHADNAPLSAAVLVPFEDTADHQSSHAFVEHRQQQAEHAILGRHHAGMVPLKEADSHPSEAFAQKRDQLYGNEASTLTRPKP